MSRLIAAVAVLALTLGAVLGDPGNVKPPKVFVYTRDLVKFGQKNTLICHCTDFHPPNLQLQLKKDGEEYQNCQDSDMTFKNDWAYQFTKSIEFTPREGETYSCDVSHNGGQVKSFILDPLM